MKFLTILLDNGKEINVKGNTVEDVPISVINRAGWASFELLNGNLAQIQSEYIIAVIECDLENANA